MKKFLFIVVLLAAVQAHATWTNKTNTDGTCTSGSSCTQSVSPTSGWLVYVVGINAASNATLSSCCGGSGCTWTLDKTTATTAGAVTIQHSINCGGTSLALGPTWGTACASGPTCHTSVYSFSTSTTLNAVDGTPNNCTTFTWCSITGLTSKNDVIVAGIVTTGDGTGCSGGSSPTCHLDTNGNGTGFEINVTGTSYSAPSWTGTSGTNNVETAAFSENTGAGSTCTSQIALTGAGCH